MVVTEHQAGHGGTLVGHKVMQTPGEVHDGSYHHHDETHNAGHYLEHAGVVQHS